MLTEALLNQGRRLTPLGLRGLPATTMRFYVGDETADLLGVPPADWTKALFGPLADLTHALSLERLHRHFVGALSKRIGFGMLSLAVHAERYGGRPAFQVPTSLAARWNLPVTGGPVEAGPEPGQPAVPARTEG